MSCESTGTKDGTHCFLDGKCVHCHCLQSATTSAPRELSDGKTYDTPCAVCGKVLDGHTHDPRELSAEEWREKYGTGYTHDDRVGYANYRIATLQSRLEAAADTFREYSLRASDEYTKVVAERDALRKELATMQQANFRSAQANSKLREALTKYGRHTDECALEWSNSLGSSPCCCGFDAALTAPAAPEPKV